MALSAIIGDKRLSINSEIKEKCLDVMRERLKEAGFQVEAIDLVLLGISVAEKDKSIDLIRPDCDEVGKKSNDKTMIISLNRLNDEQLGALIALALNKFGVENLDDTLDKAVDLWQKLTEQGLKKLYCKYFINFGSGEPDLEGFYAKIHELLKKTIPAIQANMQSI